MILYYFRKIKYLLINDITIYHIVKKNHLESSGRYYALYYCKL